MTEKIKSLALLFMATIIWGFAFVAQSKGMDYVGGFTFNCLRCILGGAVLIPVIFLWDKNKKGTKGKNEIRSDRKKLLTGGLC